MKNIIFRQTHVRMGLKPIAVRLRQTEQHQRLEFPPCGGWAYVQFRGSEFHTRNARFRQPQEQRRAKAQR